MCPFIVYAVLFCKIFTNTNILPSTSLVQTDSFSLSKIVLNAFIIIKNKLSQTSLLAIDETLPFMAEMNASDFLSLLSRMG